MPMAKAPQSEESGGTPPSNVNLADYAAALAYPPMPMDSRRELQRLQAGDDARFLHPPSRPPGHDLALPEAPSPLELSGEITGVVQGGHTMPGSIYSPSLQAELHADQPKIPPNSPPLPGESYPTSSNSQSSGASPGTDPSTQDTSQDSVPQIPPLKHNGNGAENGGGNSDSDAEGDEDDAWGEEAQGEEEEAPVDIVPEHHRVVLGFSNVEVWVPTTFQDPGMLEKVGGAVKRRVVAAASNRGGQEGKGAHTGPADTRRQVLWGITGKVQPGEVLALMGPSGSGKTTLLSVIGGRVPQRVDYSGAITANGRPLTKAVRRHIGFVLQDDVLYESLTVAETLTYAALLRLPNDMSRDEKAQRVKDVIAALGLEKAQNTIIGGYMRRGVSGGERKRVSIGHELLTNPAVLLLDEPTSGLDSTTALHLLVSLRRLANEGRAILTTIHQPSSRLYQKLDQLMLLSEGKVLYVGNAHRVVEWFDYYGFRLPYGVNTADFIMDVAMGAVRGGSRGKKPLTGRTAVTALCDTFATWYAAGGFVGFQQGVEKGQMPKLLVGSDLQKVKDQAKLEKSREGGVDVLVVPKGSDDLFQSRGGADYFQQFAVLLSRSFKVRRFEAFTGINFGQMLTVAVVTGLLWWQRGDDGDIGAANDIMGLLFFGLMFPTMRSLFSALFTFPNEYRMLLKERPSGMYRLSAYYFARTASDIPVELVMPLLFSTVLYWFGSLRHDAVSFISYLLSVLIAVFVGQSWGLLIGGSFMDPKMAQAVTTVLVLSFILVSGFWVRNIPVWIEWIRYLSFFYWANNLLLKIEFSHRSYIDCGVAGSQSQQEPCRRVTQLKEALKLPISPNSSVWPEVVVLFGMLIFLRLVTYYVLRKKTRGRKI